MDKNIEIERKFLVRGDWTKEGRILYSVIEQGYLIQDDDHVLRIRTDGHEGWLTIKSRNPGMTRMEFEYEIPYRDAQKLLDHCPQRIYKERHTVLVDQRGWTIDVFAEDNYGLVLAEIELASENDSFALPDWVGEEVTFDSKYYNADLAKHPYTSW